MQTVRSLALIAFAGAVSACGNATPRFGRGGDTVYVGVAVGLTNPERYADMFEGAQLAFDELNAKRPPSAPVLALRRAPASANSPVKVATAFRDDPQVVAVVGHTESAATIDAAPVYADREHGGRNPMVAVTPASALAVTRVSPWIYRINADMAEQGRTLARYVSDSLNQHRAAVFYRNEPSGKDFLHAFTEEFAKKGGVVIERDPFTEDISDFDGYAKRIVMQHAPAVVISGNTPQVRNTIRALHAAGGTPDVLATNGPAASDTGDFKGLRYVVLFSAERPVSAEGAHFVEAFRSKVNRAPNHWGALGYDGGKMIGQAVHDNGADRARIRDWFASVGKTRPAFPGATGSISFDENRDPVNKTVLVGRVPQ
ncbi:MAG: putative branched-chain amino acid-binding protein [Gemmatimonadetes bacterium]|nr:putative branched-chain amino acid-binding protein [Gemmatimonadota bacterium]